MTFRFSLKSKKCLLPLTLALLIGGQAIVGCDSSAPTNPPPDQRKGDNDLPAATRAEKSGGAELPPTVK